MGKDKTGHPSGKRGYHGYREEDTAQFLLKNYSGSQGLQPSKRPTERSDVSSKSQGSRSRSPERRSMSPRSVRRSGSSEEKCKHSKRDGSPQKSELTKHQDSTSGKWTVVEDVGHRDRRDMVGSVKKTPTVPVTEDHIKKQRNEHTPVTCISLCESDIEEFDFEEDQTALKKCPAPHPADGKDVKRARKRRGQNEEDVVCIEEIEAPVVKKPTVDLMRRRKSDDRSEQYPPSWRDKDKHPNREKCGERKESRGSYHTSQDKEQFYHDDRRGQSDSSDVVDVLWLTDDTQMLMVLSHPQEVSFQGKMILRSLLGAVDIFGYEVTANGEEWPVYSPACNSLMTIKTVPTSLQSRSFDRDTVVRNILTEIGEDNKNCLSTVSQKFNARSVIVLLKQLNSEVCNYVTAFTPYHQLFTTRSKQHHASKKFTAGSIDVEIMSDPLRRWGASEEEVQASQRFCQQIQQGMSPTLVVCGGKNVGKSTLARYLLNSALNHCQCVAYMECDVGQTEFTPSGCVALNLLSQPLLGPPFTHQSKPEHMCYFGALSPADEPGYYLRCLERVYKALQGLDRKLPLVVNTMGWTKGMGLQFLADTVRLVQADIIIQLDSHNRYKNMPPVNAEFVHLTPGWNHSQVSEVQKKKKHDLVILTSPVDQRLEAGDRFKALDQRNLTMLSYLGRLQPAGCPTVCPLATVKPYKLPWETVAVHVCHSAVPNSQLLCAINASVVALSVVPQDTMLQSPEPGYPMFLKHTPVCQCLGFGVVRSIDPVERVFYILSPEPLSTLKSINCLMRGALNLPDQVILTQDIDDLQLPYVGYSKDTLGASNIRPRRHMVRKLAKDPL